MEDSNNSDIYDALVQISQGKEISNWELQRMDNIVDSVRFNSSSPGKSRIKLKFSDNEDYWKLFDLSSDDIWFANAVHSNYDTFEFESSDWIEDDWKQGYILREFDTDNLEKVRDILKLIAPKHHKLVNDEDFEKASVLFENMFNRQVDEIKWSYTSERNNCKERGAIDMIETDTCKAFENYGIFSIGYCFYSYVTTVSVLLSLYKMYGNPSMTVYELLEKVGKDLSIGGDWYEFMHEQDCIDFDNESFNREVSWQLEKIMDKITDDEDFVDLKTSVEKLSTILDKYNIDEWYKLPKDPNTSFKILDINLKEEKVIVALQKQWKGIEKRSYSFEDFNTFLYQPELFEHRKFGRLK
jgi:hypothetical protein